jgi:hypothetical protein
MIMSAILTAIWTALVGFLIQFWGWFVGAGLAVLGLLFSPTLRKYTIAVLAAAAVFGGTYFYAYDKGYHAPHPIVITLPSCSAFAKHLVKGPATDKAIQIFYRNHLCQ